MSLSDTVIRNERSSIATRIKPDILLFDLVGNGGQYILCRAADEPRRAGNAPETIWALDRSGNDTRHTRKMEEFHSLVLPQKTLENYCSIMIRKRARPPALIKIEAKASRTTPIYYEFGESIFAGAFQSQNQFLQ